MGRIAHIGRLVTIGVTLALGVPVTTTSWAAEGDEVTEILVTARKRQENILEVPVSITAFSAETIERAGIRDLYDVAELTPGLSFFNAQGEFLAVPVIRGVAPTDIFGENNTAIFVDGVYISGREGLNFSQLDLERIEVVKGPQSALYGRNAFSGAINYVTRQPTQEFEGKADATLGTDGRQGGSFSVSGPVLGETLLGRVSGLYDEFDGTYDNPLGGQDIGGYRYRSWQGSLQWNATEDLTVAGSVYYSNDEIDDAVTMGIGANCENRVDTNLAVPRLLNVCGKLPSLEERAAQLRDIGTPVALQQAAYFDDESVPVMSRALGEDRELTRAHLTIDWDLDYGSLTFLTGYSETSQQALVDGSRGLGDQMPFIYCEAGVPFSGGLYLCPGNVARQRLVTELLQIEQEDNTQEFSQEIRFTSPQDRSFRYLGGVYYYDVSSKGRDGGVEAQAAPPAIDQPFGPFVPIAIGDPAFRPWFRPNGDLDPLGRVVDGQDTEAWSLFASAEYDLTDRVTVDGQIRYGEEDKSAYGIAWDEVDLDNPAPLDEGSNGKTFDAWTGRLGLKVQANDNVMIYTSVANSEKSGGFDINSVTYVEPCDLPETAAVEDCSEIVVSEFDSEELLAMEVGVKATSQDGRFVVDLSWYRNNWDNITIPEIFVDDPATGRTFSQPEAFNTNPGDATILGWDLELSYQFTENFGMRATGSYTDATYDSGRQGSFEQFPSFRPPECQGTAAPATDPVEQACRAASGSIAGNTVLRQPEWQASLSADYRRGISGNWDIFAGGDASYQGKVYVGNDNQSYLPAHTYVNLRLGIESSRYTVEVWGRNVFNDDSPIAAYRDVWFSNTADVYQQSAPSSVADDFFPFRYTVTQPRLATFGITGRVRFGGAER